MFKTKKQRDIAEIFAQKFAAGLNRTSVQLPSKWAESYRIIKTKPWTFDRHPWLRDMHDSDNPKNVGQKAAQMGFTETLLNLTFYTLDILAKDVLYVLPNKNPDAGDFSSSRLDPAREESSHINNLFTHVDNIGHKRAGIANLFIRGSNSRSGLKSIPVRFVAMDEVAEFVEANIPLAFERVSGQEEYLIWLISTPTHPDFGISKYYVQSDQKGFFFNCPSCSRKITLTFPESIVITAESINDPRLNETHLICTECKNKLPHETKSEWLKTYEWVKQFNNMEWAGWSISQLFSPTVKPRDIAVSFLNSLTNPADEVELYNSKLGLPHAVKGAQVNEEDIQRCINNGPKHRLADYVNNGSFNLITMGVDVGKDLHYVITAWVPSGLISTDMHIALKPIVIQKGYHRDIADIDKLMDDYRVVSCVMDANPESRMALDFARRYYGRVKLCYFSRSVNSRLIVPNKDPNEPKISVNRSAWLDLSQGRFKNGTILLPVDTSLEYRNHIKTPVKTYKPDSDGNPVTVYLTEGSKPDHFAFAQCYNEMALDFAVSGNDTVDTELPH